MKGITKSSRVKFSRFFNLPILTQLVHNISNTGNLQIIGVLKYEEEYVDAHLNNPTNINHALINLQEYHRRKLKEDTEM